MTSGDWIVMGFLAPLLITVLWVIVIRVWLAGLRVDDAVSWFAGEGRGLRGYHAGLGPGVLSMTVGWIGYLLEGFGVDSYGDGPGAALVNGLYLLCLVLLLLMAWLWAFQRPRFLVPPQYRD